MIAAANASLSPDYSLHLSFTFAMPHIAQRPPSKKKIYSF
jgi:hypothetical protein